MTVVKRYKKEQNESYALGMTLTIELLRYRPESTDRVFMHPDLVRHEAYDLLESLCKANDIPLEVNVRAFNVLSPKENCFVIGLFRKFGTQLATDQSHIVLVNPANAGNLGTIIRSGIGFGMDNLALIRPAVDIFDPKVVRASMGSLFKMRFEYFDDFSSYIRRFGRHNCYPFMLQAGSPLPEVRFKEPFALIFGNEATGLPALFSDMGQSVVIPQTDQIDSLNLPIAVSIALYESAKANLKERA